MSRTFRSDRRIKVRNPYVVPSHQRRANLHETERDKERRRRRSSPMVDESGDPLVPFYEPDQADRDGLDFIDSQYDDDYLDWELECAEAQ